MDAPLNPNHSRPANPSKKFELWGQEEEERGFMSFGSISSLNQCTTDGIVQLVHERSQVLSPKPLEVNPCNLSRWEQGSWDLSLHTGPKAQVSSMTWMSTWQHFLEARLGTCVGVGLSKKASPNSQHKSH